MARDRTWRSGNSGIGGVVLGSSGINHQHVTACLFAYVAAALRLLMRLVPP